MGIIETLIEEIGSSDKSLQMKKICDEIFGEEEDKFEYINLVNYLMDGPNTFLTIEVPGRTKKEICFVCLEREFYEEFVIAIWSLIKKDFINREGEYDVSSLRRVQAWKIKDSSVKEILKEFAKTVKFMRGEI